MTEVTKEARGLATVGHEGGLTTAAMDGRSMATKVAMLAFRQRRVTKKPRNGGLQRRLPRRRVMA